jgi:UDP-N-acetylglucosamine 2-epimerase (hydrolysing)
MYSDNLPSIEETKEHYEIPFDDYSIFIYHPVTTELETLENNINEVVSATLESDRNYVVIYPNNDDGSDIIIDEIDKLSNNENFKVFPSIRFEHFLTLLKNSDYIMGNSSVGSRISEIYGIPSINIGSRQKNRSKSKNIINVDNKKEEILGGILKAENKKIKPISHFGRGDSAKNFYKIITEDDVWQTKIQKQFLDLPKQNNKAK